MTLGGDLNSRGYTTVEADAGLYERNEAEEIVRRANYGGRLDEEIVETVQPPLKEQIAARIPEINPQNNRCTRSPYYFVVQSKRWVDTAHDGEKKVIAYDGHLYTLEEWLALAPSHTEESWEEERPFQLRAEWEDKGVFLTETACAQVHPRQRPSSQRTANLCQAFLAELADGNRHACWRSSAGKS